jgi:hypothetical protein
MDRRVDVTNLAESVISQALDLNALERSILVERLVASLDIPDPSIDEIWGKEADARVEAFNRGEISAVSASAVFQKYKK